MNSHLLNSPVWHSTNVRQILNHVWTEVKVCRWLVWEGRTVNEDTSIWLILNHSLSLSLIPTYTHTHTHTHTDTHTHKHYTHTHTNTCMHAHTHTDTHTHNTHTQQKQKNQKGIKILASPTHQKPVLCQKWLNGMAPSCPSTTSFRSSANVTALLANVATTVSVSSTNLWLCCAAFFCILTLTCTGIQRVFSHEKGSLSWNKLTDDNKFD